MVILALRDELCHSIHTLPQWPAEHLEVIAARVSVQQGWLTVAVFYNPHGTATYLELDHNFSLPPPVLILGRL